MSEEVALQCKVVLIGETRVGKTSIINRYIANTFSSIFTPSLCASYVTKVDNFEEYNYSIKFEIWDTAGQEKFRSLAKVFYNNASVCVMVYDITNKKSFDELKSFWADNVRDNVSGSACK